MERQRINLIPAVGMIMCLLAGSTFGKPNVAHKHHGRGHVIVRPQRPAVTVRPYGRTIHRRPYFHRTGPGRPHRRLVIVRTPYGRIIKAYPVARVVTRFGVVEPSIVRVWFINTSGTRTGVELVRRRLGYIGPRGEWYERIPTKRQLWIAYGY